MKRDTLEQDLQLATLSLLNLARGLTYNKISDKCFYVLSEIENSDTDLLKQRELRKRKNERKTPMGFNELLTEIRRIFDVLYDVNLYIYKAKKNETIIEVQYYSKLSLEKEFLNKVINEEPMIHMLKYRYHHM